MKITNYKRIIAALTLLFPMCPLTYANDTISVEINRYQIDHIKKLIVVNQDIDEINLQWTDTKEAIICTGQYNFENPVQHIEIGIGYPVNDSSDTQYQLYFSEIPIIAIHTDLPIIDDPKVLASFIMSEKNQPIITSTIGIELRGASALGAPKKSYRFEFWQDNEGDTTKDLSLLGMRSDDDWNLFAMYNEPLRLRRKTNNEIWNDIHPIHYKNIETEAYSGINSEYVEVFLNDEYLGIFSLGESVDRKQLKIKKYNGTIRGELYKGVSWGASTFTAVPSYDNHNSFWGGFEYIYPDQVTNWSNIHAFVDFVVNSPNDVFYDHWQSKFELDNAVDYYIFLNLLRATDNTGKNTFIAKYNTGHKYFYIPWDLDGTFGIIWDGSIDTTANDILSNGFYGRLIHDCAENGFVERLQERWTALRDSIITHEHIVGKFMRHYNYLNSNGAYERENMLWNDNGYDSTHITYISDWLTRRLKYLDSKFLETCEPLAVEDNDLPNDFITIYPNPANDFVYIHIYNYTEPIQLRIINAVGQAVSEQKLVDEMSLIDISALSNGIYFATARRDNMSITKKIIVQ